VNADNKRLMTALELASNPSIMDLKTFLAKVIFGPPKGGIADSTPAQRAALKAVLVSKFSTIPQVLSDAIYIASLEGNSDVQSELFMLAADSPTLTNFIGSATLTRWPSRPD
jgi:hypothetical protein